METQLNLEAWNIDTEDEGARLMKGFRIKRPRVTQERSFTVKSEDGVKKEMVEGMIKEEEFSDGQGTNEDDEEGEDEDDEEDEENDAFPPGILSNRGAEEAANISLGKMTFVIECVRHVAKS